MDTIPVFNCISWIQVLLGLLLHHELMLHHLDSPLLLIIILIIIVFMSFPFLRFINLIILRLIALKSVLNMDFLIAVMLILFIMNLIFILFRGLHRVFLLIVLQLISNIKMLVLNLSFCGINNRNAVLNWSWDVLIATLHSAFVRRMHWLLAVLGRLVEVATLARVILAQHLVHHLLLKLWGILFEIVKIFIIPLSIKILTLYFINLIN